MGRHENMPSPVPAQIRDYKMFDVEIKYGLLQVRRRSKEVFFYVGS
jgi:SCY1-like protein 2